MQLKQNNTPLVAHQYTYDVQNRPATVSDGVNTATYAYKPGLDLLNTTTIANASGTLLTATRSYDNFYRLTSVSSATGGATPLTRAYSYVYNDNDQRTKLTLADGTYWLYTYDAKGQVISGKKYNSTGHEISGQSFGYNYDDIGNLVYEKRGIEDMKIDYTANNVNQYTKRAIPGVAPVIGEAGTDITVKAIRTDKRDPDMESVITMTRSGRYFKGAFHGVDNVSAAKEVTYTVYALKDDPATSKQLIRKVNGSCTVPKRNQLYTYDTDGNMLTNGVWTYTWNGENRLIVAEKSDQKLEFAYDYQGRRVSKKVYTGSTGSWTLDKTEKYVWDDWNVVATYDSSNVLQKSYLWGIDLSGSLQGAGGVGGLLAVTENSNSYFPCYDGNGNVRNYFDGTGSEVASYDYNPFGKIIVESGTKKDDFAYRFSTKPLDTETGLIGFELRTGYNPEIGRFISRDPVAENGGTNLYGFVQNNPIDKWDYLGMKAKNANKIYVTLLEGPRTEFYKVAEWWNELGIRLTKKKKTSKDGKTICFEHKPNVSPEMVTKSAGVGYSILLAHGRLFYDGDRISPAPLKLNDAIRRAQRMAKARARKNYINAGRDIFKRAKDFDRNPKYPKVTVKDLVVKIYLLGDKVDYTPAEILKHGKVPNSLISKNIKFYGCWAGLLKNATLNGLTISKETFIKHLFIFLM